MRVVYQEDFHKSRPENRFDKHFCKMFTFPMESLANPENPISPSAEAHSAKGSALPDGANYAGHSKHCECEKMAKEFERAYTERTRTMALLERVARAAQRHRHAIEETECPICIYLRELNG